MRYTVEAVQLSFKEQSPEQQLQTFNASLQRYQQENTALFFMIYGSIDMRGDWELNDLTTVEESFQQGDLRDGLGLLKWVQSFYDLSSDSGQIKAREPDFTSDSILLLVGKHRAWARPVHGEIWIQRMDNHPSQKSKEAREY